MNSFLKDYAVPASLVLTVFAVFLFVMYIDWDRPPVDSVQQGYRGTGMEDVFNPRTEADTIADNMVPEPPWELDTSGDRAGDIYENVQVLGDLSEDQFTRLMTAITAWVAPEEQGCNYCHNPDNLADDSVYTKIVSRKMIQMTQHINADWTDHVRDIGVTCYTCHRGNSIPVNVWAENPGPREAGGFAASRRGQNVAGTQVGLASLPTDPFSPFLSGDTSIRVQSTSALPSGDASDVQQTEWTYALMIHMSQSLGQNCTFCHNSRSMGVWAQSPPPRVSAWYGIRMVRDINNNWIEPLDGVFPANGDGQFGDRRGPEGDLLKTNCGTCHNGVNKPLYGAPMAADYPSLAGN